MDTQPLLGGIPPAEMVEPEVELEDTPNPASVSDPPRLQAGMMF